MGLGLFTALVNRVNIKITCAGSVLWVTTSDKGSGTGHFRLQGFFLEELGESRKVAMALQFPAQNIPREVKHSPVMPFTCTTTGSISEVRRTEELSPLANTTVTSASVTLLQTAGLCLGTITCAFYSQVF